jgi:hypothetical protein
LFENLAPCSKIYGAIFMYLFQGGIMKYVFCLIVALCCSVSYADNSTAQGVAETQARRGKCVHVGGNSGYEGVGFSSRSADHAIKSCCYWGKRKPLDIGVARGHNGWYACVRYK